MSSENKAAIRALRAERRSLITRIQNTEANLAKLRSRLSFTELKPTCFGCNMERLRAAKLPRKMFKGRNIYRRILDLQRKAERALTHAEIAIALAEQGGLDTSKMLTRLSGATRV
jgi:hypothetical protein